VITRSGEDPHKTSLWRSSATRVVLIVTCVVIVTIAALADHVMIAGGLALFFGLLAWIAGHDNIVDETEKMNGFYRALGRVDAGTSRQRFGGGPIGRWAGALREADYRSLVSSIADATRRSDESADALLREMYERRATRIA
jgi:hypothetical protein